MSDVKEEKLETIEQLGTWCKSRGVDLRFGSSGSGVRASWRIRVYKHGYHAIAMERRYPRLHYTLTAAIDAAIGAWNDGERGK